MTNTNIILARQRTLRYLKKSDKDVISALIIPRRPVEPIDLWRTSETGRSDDESE